MQTVEEYIESIEHKTRREDAKTLLPLMTKWSGYEPYLSGSIIGFGRYHYKYDSGHEGDCYVTAFAPRKAQMVVYIMPGYDDYSHYLEKIGKYKMGKSCLYLTNLKNNDLEVLGSMVKDSVKIMQSRYDCQPSPKVL